MRSHAERGNEDFFSRSHAPRGNEDFAGLLILTRYPIAYRRYFVGVTWRENRPKSRPKAQTIKVRIKISPM